VTVEREAEIVLYCKTAMDQLDLLIVDHPLMKHEIDLKTKWIIDCRPSDKKLILSPTAFSISERWRLLKALLKSSLTSMWLGGKDPSISELSEPLLRNLLEHWLQVVVDKDKIWAFPSVKNLQI